ncbi:MAG: 2-C-methyl-D-erythritol 2,4-cyclodiphosphate synthase [Actinomycetota bacterium]
MRVGIGFDAHRFAPGRPLILGGVEIPYDRGLEGHSDADVLTHAICDALLGACGLPDIGEMFPSTDEELRNASSSRFLEEIVPLLARSEYRIVNIDAIVIAEAPRLQGHREAIGDRLARALSLPPSAVAVKATTTDGMGFTGRGEGISALATCLLEPA